MRSEIMMKKRDRIIIALLLLFGVPAIGQTATLGEVDDYDRSGISGRMELMLDDMHSIFSDVKMSVKEEELTKLEKELTIVDIMWNACYSAQQVEIAASNSLLLLVTDYHAIKQEIADSIGVKRHNKQCLDDFLAAEKFILSQDTVYTQMSASATKYAMVKKMTPQLEKLKAQEQIIFQDIQAQYEKAKAVTEEVPKFKKRMDPLQDSYLSLKSSSEKIQAAVYKPFFQRIKDYLLGFAAVAMILMFFNMIITKIKAAKQVRANAKKIAKMMDGADSEYPTI